MSQMPCQIVFCSRLKKVGWIFSQSTADRDFIMSVDEIKQISAMQVEICNIASECFLPPMQSLYLTEECSNSIY